MDEPAAAFPPPASRARRQPSRPCIGVSACLLGQRVRYDGDHRREAFITEDLGEIFNLVPLCPEVEAGLGIPREAIHLEGDADAPRVVSTQARVDHTDVLLASVRARIEALAALGICGVLLKKNSPSCGIERVKLYLGGSEGGERAGQDPLPIGTGVFARVFKERFPDLPMMDEETLRDPARAAEFICRVRAAHAEAPRPSHEETN